MRDGETIGHSLLRTTARLTGVQQPQREGERVRMAKWLTLVYEKGKRTGSPTSTSGKKTTGGATPQRGTTQQARAQKITSEQNN